MFFFLFQFTNLSNVVIEAMFLILIEFGSVFAQDKRGSVESLILIEKRNRRAGCQFSRRTIIIELWVRWKINRYSKRRRSLRDLFEEKHTKTSSLWRRVGLNFSVSFPLVHIIDNYKEKTTWHINYVFLTISEHDQQFPSSKYTYY